MRGRPDRSARTDALLAGMGRDRSRGRADTPSIIDRALAARDEPSLDRRVRPEIRPSRSGNSAGVAWPQILIEAVITEAE